MDKDARVEILRRRVIYEQNPEAFCAQWCEAEAALSQRIVTAQLLLPSVAYTSDDLYTIAYLTSEMEVDGHRADIVILKAAIAHAAFEGRDAVNELDILLAAELALPHRLRRKPFEETRNQMQKLERRLEEARAEASLVQEAGEGDGEYAQSKKKRTP